MSAATMTFSRCAGRPAYLEASTSRGQRRAAPHVSRRVLLSLAATGAGLAAGAESAGARSVGPSREALFEVLPGETWSATGVQEFKRPSPEPERVTAPPGSAPVIILPGFGNCASDYEAPFGDASLSLATSLRARGFVVSVLSIQKRTEWVRVAAGILQPGFWSGSLTAEPGYGWYLDLIDASVGAARAATGAEKVVLLAHSAGGWLARAYIGGRFPRFAGAAPGRRGADYVAALVTLGTPHWPPSEPVADAKGGNPQPPKDMTGGALSHTARSYPGAYFPRIAYTSVAGRSVRADATPPPKGAPRPLALYSARSYEAVAGVGDHVVGDAVVPTAYALLEGTRQLVIPGVFHSVSRVGTFEERGEYPWYGSEEVVDLWAQALLAPAGRGRPADVDAAGSGPGEGEEDVA